MDSRGARFAPRDFLRAGDGLYFAVVAPGIEDGRVLSILRYEKSATGLQKLDSRQAQRLLEERHPEWLYHSPVRDVTLHGVPVTEIEEHLIPTRRAAELLQAAAPDAIEEKAARFLNLLAGHNIPADALGLTGSHLVGAQHPSSDIDVVVTDRDVFADVRSVIRRLLENGLVDPLSPEMWRATHARRGCSLSLDDYIWHERRKFNKLVTGGTKIDVSLALREEPPPAEPFRKLRRIDLTAKVTDDAHSFDYPAVWTIDSPLAPTLISWTPTYTGQGLAGETIHMQGWLEESETGRRQIIVGTSREAAGESIAVVRS